MSNDHTLVLSTVTATIHAPTEESLYRGLALQSSRRGVSALLARTHRCRNDHNRRWPSDVDQRRNHRRCINHRALCRRDPGAAPLSHGLYLGLHHGQWAQKVLVEWKLSVKAVGRTHCEYSNHVYAAATGEFLLFWRRTASPLNRLGQRTKALAGIPTIAKRRQTSRRALSAELCSGSPRVVYHPMTGSAGCI